MVFPVDEVFRPHHDDAPVRRPSLCRPHVGGHHIIIAVVVSAQEVWVAQSLLHAHRVGRQHALSVVEHGEGERLVLGTDGVVDVLVGVAGEEGEEIARVRLVVGLVCAVVGQLHVVHVDESLVAPRTSPVSEVEPQGSLAGHVEWHRLLAPAAGGGRQRSALSVYLIVAQVFADACRGRLVDVVSEGVVASRQLRLLEDVVVDRLLLPPGAQAERMTGGRSTLLVGHLVGLRVLHVFADGVDAPHVAPSRLRVHVFGIGVGIGLCGLKVKVGSQQGRCVSACRECHLAGIVDDACGVGLVVGDIGKVNLLHLHHTVGLRHQHEEHASAGDARCRHGVVAHAPVGVVAIAVHMAREVHTVLGLLDQFGQLVLLLLGIALGRRVGVVLAQRADVCAVGRLILGGDVFARVVLVEPPAVAVAAVGEGIVLHPHRRLVGVLVHKGLQGRDDAVGSVVGGSTQCCFRLVVWLLEPVGLSAIEAHPLEGECEGAELGVLRAVGDPLHVADAVGLGGVHLGPDEVHGHVVAFTAALLEDCSEGQSLVGIVARPVVGHSVVVAEHGDEGDAGGVELVESRLEVVARLLAVLVHVAQTKHDVGLGRVAWEGVELVLLARAAVLSEVDDGLAVVLVGAYGGPVVAGLFDMRVREEDRREIVACFVSAAVDFQGRRNRLRLQPSGGCKRNRGDGEFDVHKYGVSFKWEWHGSFTGASTWHRPWCR